MNRLRQLIHEIHRRSLWQVLLIYVGASWAVLQVVDTAAGALQLPDWLEPVALLLLIVGLPIVLATAFVQEGVSTQDVRQSDTAPGAALFTWRNALGGGVLAFALWGVIAAGWVLAGGTPGDAAGGSASRDVDQSVAVLPCANFSADPNGYFSDGFTDALLNALAQLPGLRVPGRTTSFALRDQGLTIQQFADTLNVAHVLECSVQRDAGRILITAQLVDARADSHLWSQTFERELRDIFAIQREIATAIAEELEVSLSGEERETLVVERTNSPEAYDFYLRGWAAYSSRTTLADVDAAIRFYERAIELDPQFALAYAGAAQAWYNRPNYGGDGPGDRVRAEEMARTAVSLDESLAPANLVLANLARTQWRWEESERLYLSALERQPNDAEAHHEYGEYLLTVGRCVESAAEQRRAIELDPFSAIFPGYLGNALWCAGGMEEGLQYAVDAMERGSPFVAPSLVFILLEMGRVDEAVDFARSTDRAWELSVAEAVRDGAGRLDELRAAAPGNFRGLWGLAVLGDEEGIAQGLTASLERHVGTPYPIWSQAFWDVVDRSPGLQALLPRFGFEGQRPAL